MNVEDYPFPITQIFTQIVCDGRWTLFENVKNNCKIKIIIHSIS